MKKRGFSLVELIVVMSIALTLLGLITISLSSTQQKASLGSTVYEFISDLNQQKIKAMTGDSEGRISADSYGVHIDLERYVLFHGSSYLSTDPSNFNIKLPSNQRFVSVGTDIIFQRVSGEIAAPVSISIEDMTINDSKTIQINRYGVVTGVN